MPALFAYLVALVLLLSGGYGALHWLAAPEPVKVAAKVKPKPSSPHYEAIAVTPDSSESSTTATAAAATPPAGDDQEPAPKSDAKDQTTTANVSEPPQDQQSRAAHAEIIPAETLPVKEAEPQPVKENVRPAPSVPSNRQPTAVPAASTTTGAKITKRPRLVQAGGRTEKPATVDRRRLAVMTLRTVEFPDGRRVSQLIPYRSAGRDFDD